MPPKKKSGRGFEYFTPTLVTRASSLNRVALTNHKLDSVPAAFDRLSTTDDNLAVWCDKVIPGNEYGRYDLLAATGKSNHFQGIQRLQAPQSIAISGSHKEEGISHLFVGELATRHADLPWRANRFHRKRPQGPDKVNLVIGINADASINQALGLTDSLWHAGGLASSGDVLAVPLEGDAPGAAAKIVFYDLSEPSQPRIFRLSLTRPDAKAGCVAFTGWDSGLILAAVLAKNGFGRQQLDFYLFESKLLIKQTEILPLAWDSSQLLAATGFDATFHNYENIQFVQEASGALYLIGIHKPGTFNDNNPRAGEADLFKLDFWSSPADWTNPTQFNLRQITKIGNKQFPSNRKFDFDAGSSVYVDPHGGLTIYSVFDFKEEIEGKGMISFVEFHPNSSRFHPDSISAIEDAWVELYTDRNFTGRCLSLAGLQSLMLADFSDIYVGEDMLNNQISSIRYQLPHGRTYRLFNDKKFSTRGGFLDLTGFEGRVIVRSDLREQGFDNKVSSACLLP